MRPTECENTVGRIDPPPCGDGADAYCTMMVRPTRGKTGTCDVVGWRAGGKHGRRATCLSLRNTAFPHSGCGRGRDVRPLHVPSTRTWNKQCVNQRGLAATESSTSDFWRDVWREIGAQGGLGDDLCESRRPPLLMRCVLASSLRTTGLAMTCLMLLASLWFWSTVPRLSFGRGGTRPAWPSPAWLTGLRQWGLRGDVWTSLRSGFLDEGERLRGDTSVRDHGLSRCRRSFRHPTTWAQFRWRLLRARGRAVSAN